MIARAPGKLILSGEHAVVYGCPALVAAIDLCTTVTVSRSAEDTSVHLRVGDQAFRWQAAVLEALQLDLDSRHQQFLSGKRPIQEVVTKPEQLLAYAASLYAKPGTEIHCTTELPLGGGLGSSASLCCAIIQATANLAGKSPSPDELYQAALRCERLQHGRPSGVDPAIIVHGGMLRFHAGKKVQVSGDLSDLHLWYTGQPDSTTGECVEHVRAAAHPQSLWDAFRQVTHAIQRALESQDRRLLRDAMRHNHRLLVQIGIVPKAIQNTISSIEAEGGAAKVSGAGTIRGDAAGAVLVLPGTAQLDQHLQPLSLWRPR